MAKQDKQWSTTHTHKTKDRVTQYNGNKVKAWRYQRYKKKKDTQYNGNKVKAWRYQRDK
jgi:hypothetical protein